MSSSQSLGIIGSGASAIYLLKNLLDHLDRLDPPVGTISIFEKSRHIGTGMPYSPETTDRWNLSNISSEELPELVRTFAEWLREQDATALEEMGVSGEIDEGEVYPRLALGRYLSAQYKALLGLLAEAGVEIHEFPGCRVADIRGNPADLGVALVTEEGLRHDFDLVVIATGHCWPVDDQPERGYYTSPWPIRKLLPEKGKHFNFAIGALGASLSAFDLLSSLAHRHGEFIEGGQGRLEYRPHPGTENFKIVMHSAEGLLPHLQFDQVEAMREIYRHVSREDLLALVDARGYLRLETYFDKVCRPALKDAFEKDGMPELAELLGQPGFHLKDFVERMTEDHEYADPFAGMRREMREARESVLRHRPIHWKEILDDLIYTLNFHVELLPAEDHLRLTSEVLPFVMNVIAAMPLPSGETILALHEAGKLELIAGKVEIPEHQPNADGTRVIVSGGKKETTLDYRMFVDCSGQKPVGPDDYPFQSLVRAGKVREARAVFSDPEKAAAVVPEAKRERVSSEGSRTYLGIGGVEVDAGYRLIGADGKPNARVFDIAFSHASGLRPYSYGLQACNETARILVTGLVG